MDAGSRYRVYSAVASLMMMEASSWALPSSHTEKKARAVASMCSLWFVEEGLEAMMKRVVGILWRVR